MPDRYIRKQTLVNAERYITEELKELEDTILGAEEKLFAFEYKCGILGGMDITSNEEKYYVGGEPIN